MKKTKKTSDACNRPVRILEPPALAGATGGTLPDPYIGHQHNETLVRACPRRRRARR